MADRKAAGEDFSARLSARGSAGISRRAMADGGEGYSGSLASRALRAVNARAMTVEGGDIVVGNDFDASRPEDAALYAHERLHQSSSGGSGGGAEGHNDAEEQAARSVEAMVFHRMQAGENLTEVLTDATKGSTADLARNALSNGSGAVAQVVGKVLDGGDPADPMNSYWMQRTQGKPHAEIVDDLKRHVVQQLEHMHADQQHRSAGS